jgi:hypothetical protein
MRCLICGVATDSIELFLKVNLCPKCAKQTRQLRDRARSELQNIVATLDDVLREALCTASAGLELDRVESLSGEEVINYILALNKHFRRDRPMVGKQLR